MNIVIIGATGFIGRTTVAHLLGKGDSITALVRDVEKSVALLGNEINIASLDLPLAELRSSLENTDVVINLSGAPIAETRWTKRRKQELIDSRVGISELVSSLINECDNPPRTLISASAVGYYGDRGLEVLTEDSHKGTGYLSDMCQHWELASEKSSSSGTRVCLLRLGIVLGREGGFLKQVGTLCEMGLAMCVGSQQYMSWIHITDVIRIISRCIEDPSLSGSLNCTAPNPVTADKFASEMQHVTRARFKLRIHPLLLWPILGEGYSTLTQSQNAIPKRLQNAGFRFNHTNLMRALQEELTHPSIGIDDYRKTQNNLIEQPNKWSEILDKGQYVLSSEVLLGANRKTLFSFFSSPSNIGTLTPKWMNCKIISEPASVCMGSKITYKIKVWFLPFTWETRILDWVPDEYFVDNQERGPYKIWFHEHRILPHDDYVSRMRDRVTYTVPAGPLGRLLHILIIKNVVRRIFAFRSHVMKTRFPLIDERA